MLDMRTTSWPNRLALQDSSSNLGRTFFVDYYVSFGSLYCKRNSYLRRSYKLARVRALGDLVLLY